MLLRRQRATTDDRPDVIVQHGPSLAKGPNLLIGSILVAYGLSGLLRTAGHQFPAFSDNFPGGNAVGASWLGPEINGWTVWLCILAGALLLFGAAQHHLAKLMSLIVGLGLAAAAVIGFVDGDVLGLAAANGWTELGWGVAAVLLALNVFSPRRRREHEVGVREPTYARDEPAPTYAGTAGEPVTGEHRTGRFFGRRRDRDRDGVPDEQETAVAERAPAGDGVSARREDDPR